MDDQEAHDRAGTLSVKDMQGWLRDEIRDSAKAHELRVKDATAFVTEYTEGKLTPEQAMDRLVEHDRRWGEALPGATASPGLSDEAIVQQIDKARDELSDRSSFRTSITGKSGGPYR